MSSVGAVVVTYNIGSQINILYESLEKQVQKIIFIDNNSDKLTVKVLKKIKESDEKVSIILNNKNEGIAKAINLGIKSLHDKVDFILTLDHDSILEKNMVFSMLNFYKDKKDLHNIGIISPAIFDKNKKGFLLEVQDKTYQKILEPIQSGALIPISIFDDIGYFNEDLFIYYVDTDIAYRCEKMGYECFQLNNIKLIHEEGRKTEHRLWSKTVYYNNYGKIAIYYRARNYIYMIVKYGLDFRDKKRIVIDAIKIILFDKNKLKSLRVHLKGVFDGIKLFVFDNINGKV